MVKTKVRFDGLDVAAMVAHWNHVALGRRVINIYNGSNGDTYIFKLDKQTRPSSSSSTTTTSEADDNIHKDEPSSTPSSSNILLLLESGVRFHTTHLQQDQSAGMPSPFCMKLRKHIRGLRLESVSQLGTFDRVVHFVFGTGPSRHSLILELYARGNLILTNATYHILALLRSHQYNTGTTTSNDDENDKNEKTIGGEKKEGTVQVKVGHAYPVTYATTMTGIDSQKDGNNDDDNNATTLLHATNPLNWFLQQQLQSSSSKQEEKEQSGGTASNRGKRKKNDNNNSSQNAWKTLLLKPSSGVSQYGPSLLEHCLRCANLWGADKKYPSDMTTEHEWMDLQSILQTEGNRILKDIVNDEPTGYILYQAKKKNNQQTDNNDDDIKDDQCSNNKDSMTPLPTASSIFEDKILLEFQPHLLKQHETMLRLEYKTFDDAVDTFFSHLESQKRILRADHQQLQAEQRLEKIRLDQQQRVTTLIHQQEELQEQARLVELHADMVEKALQVVNSALDSGMDWDHLEDLVELEKVQNRNPVAMLIHKLDLEHDQMTLRLVREEVLYDNNDDYDDNENTNNQRFQDVTISLNETAHGNAKALFAKYRASKEKSKKTIEASTKAMEAAEETAKRQLLEAQNRKSHVAVQAKRKPLWFEKFNWFITTDNYLVLGGRDAQQNELLVKRYLRAGDAYLHADVHGAASCVLRAKRRRDPKTGKTIPIPLSNQALQEAGNFTICRSSAWKSRMVTSAWWVESHQVSKTAPTGEYLTVGSFMVRGKKNFLPPTQLEMGLAVLFRLGDDDSVLRHKDERRDFALMQLEEEQEDELVDNDSEAVFINRVNKTKGDDNELQEDRSSNDNEAIESNDATKIVDVSNDDARHQDEVAAEGMDATDNKTDETYAMEEDTDGKMEIDETEEPTSQKKGLSVKERKLIKKYGSLQAAREADERRRRQEEEKDRNSETSSALSKETSQTHGTQGTHKRGKKAKLKKMAKKYADQDSEDRELALLALHAGEKFKKVEKKKSPQTNKKEKEAAAETIAILTKDPAATAEQLPQAVRDTLAKCVTVVDSNEESIVLWDKFDGDILEQLQSFELEAQMEAAANRLLSLKESCRIDNFSASLAGIIRTIRKYGHEGQERDTSGATQNDGKRKKKAEKEAKEESWKNTLVEEGVVDGDYDEENTFDDTAELTKLTGKPLGEDLVLFAVPVCAPYQCLSQYTYRVKLTPGIMKRGKAAKQCVDMFLKEGPKGAAADRCRDLIKKVADNEWVQAICGDVKISAAGASKAVQKSKAKSKNNKKK